MNNVRQSYIREKKNRINAYTIQNNLQLPIISNSTNQPELRNAVSLKFLSRQAIASYYCLLIRARILGRLVGERLLGKSFSIIICIIQFSSVSIKLLMAIHIYHSRRAAALSIYLYVCQSILYPSCLSVCLFFFEIVNLFVMFILFLWPSHTTRNIIIFLAHFFS